MQCEIMQERVSRLLDDELDEPGQEELFRHFNECSACRLFLGSMMRFRKASANDRDALLREADERLSPASSIVAPRPTQRASFRWPALPGASQRMPAAAALALAVALLIVGLVLGARLAGRSTQVAGARSGETGVAGVGSTPRTIIVCGLPGIEVVGFDPVRTNESR